MPLNVAIHTAIKNVSTAMFESHSFNVAIAELMKLSNRLGEAQSHATDTFANGVENLVLMLTPLAPHAASEMHEYLHHDCRHSLEGVTWPRWDESMLKQANSQVVLQVQGRVRDTLTADGTVLSDKHNLVKLALESKSIQKHLRNRNVRKTIVVIGKKSGAHSVVNFVV